MKFTDTKYKALRFLFVAVFLFATPSFAIRMDTFDREPPYFSSPHFTLSEKVEDLQDRADKIAHLCEIREYRWCRDLGTIDLSIKNLRGEVTDPIYKKKRHANLESRARLLDSQVKWMEDKMRYAE